jgi:hypothetical protein
MGPTGWDRPHPRGRQLNRVPDPDPDPASVFLLEQLEGGDLFKTNIVRDSIQDERVGCARELSIDFCHGAGGA